MPVRGYVSAGLLAFCLGIGALCVDASPAVAQGQGADQAQPDKTMKIRIHIADATLAATLDDNATARDFFALLPLSLTLTDFSSTEKIADLPRRLSTEGAPAGYDPALGDIAYYAPWGNLAIFYRDFRYSRNLIRLGRLESGIGRLSSSGPVAVTIEPR